MPLKVSWTGSERAFELCAETLIAAVLETTVAWKKKGAQFPSHVSLPISFVPFEQHLIMSTHLADYKQQKIHCALSHLFFIDCLDADGYKKSVRSDMVEWFAKLRNASCSEWLIVIDTGRARENKTRAALMERIKSDFAKYLAKLVEIDGNSSKIYQVAKLLREQLLFAWDALVSHCEENLQLEKERCKHLDWDFFAFLNAKIELINLYRIVGLSDNVEGYFDVIDALLSLLIMEFSRSDTKPNWLTVLRDRRPPSCPSLLNLMKPNSIIFNCALPKMSYLELRMWLLAQQLLLLMHRFETKRVHDGRGSTETSLRTHFCSLVLQQLYKCLTTVIDEAALLHLEWRPHERCCWIALFCCEGFDLCKTLCDPVQVHSADTFTCLLWLQLCASLKELGDRCDLVVSSPPYPAKKHKAVQDLLCWLPSNSTDNETTIENEGPCQKLRDLLSSQEVYGHLMQKFHESAMAVLKHFSWKRNSRLLAKRLADYLVKLDRLEGALQYYLKFLNTLSKESWTYAYSQTVETVIKLFESMPDLYSKELIEFSECLAVNGSSEEVARAYALKLARLLSADHSAPFRLKTSSFRVSSAVSVLPRVAVRGEVVNCQLTMHSQCPVGLCPVSVQFYWRLHSALLSPHRRPTLPRFDFTTETDVARFQCVSGVNQMLNARQSDVGLEADCPNSFVFRSNKVCTIEPKRNYLQLEGSTENAGYYCVDHIDVIFNAVTFVVDIPPITSMSFRVKTEPPWVELVPLNDVSFAGVIQHFTLVVYSGTDAISTPSQALVETVQDSAVVEFLKNNCWSSQYSADIPSLGPRTRSVHSVSVCCLLESLSNSGPVKATLKISWLGRTWIPEFYFRPILYLTSRTSILEEKVLLEVEAWRCNGLMTLEPTEATLVEWREDGEGLPAKLLSQRLNKLPSQSRHNLVWLLTAAPSSDNLQYSLVLSYNVEGEEEERGYCYKSHLTVDWQPPEYELCCQMCPDEPRAVLCRSGSVCHLIISLRCLRLTGPLFETLLLGVECPRGLWRMDQRQKLVTVKESGLGQTVFSIVPLVSGFLPYPTIQLHRCQQQTNGADSLSNQVSCFVRTQAKQVHVLSPLPNKPLAAVNPPAEY